MKNIVGVKFESKYSPGEYSGKEYCYFLADGIKLQKGDIIQVPTKNGDGIAMVARTNIPERELDYAIMPYMRTITSGPLSTEEVENETLLAATESFFTEV